MRRAIYYIRHTNCRCGFSLAELLISLAVMAMLLTAVAIAFNASVINYGENEDIFRAVNNARQALLRITSQIRTADAVDPSSPVNQCSSDNALAYQFQLLSERVRSLH